MNRKTETYQKIIEAASKCFAKNGFNATSIKEIAMEANISQGGMYTYFSSKTDLIKAIVEEETLTGLEKYRVAKQGTNFEKLYSIVISCINEVGYPVNHDLWIEILAESSRNEALCAIFLQGDEKIRQGIISLLETGKKEGEFKQSFDSTQMAYFIIAFIDGLITRKAINKDFSLENNLPEVKSYMHQLLS